jgi:hypothetical protein
MKEEKCLWVVVKLLEEIFVICVIVNHENLPQVFLTVRILDIRQGFHIKEVTIFTDTDDWLVLLCRNKNRLLSFLLLLSGLRKG